MLKFQRVLSSTDQKPYDTVNWTSKDIRVTGKEDEIIYECPNAEFPTTWSEGACNIVASKYFRESRNHDDKETSVKQMIERVVVAIVAAGLKQEYFGEEDAEVFGDELRMILLHQYASLNSPVWFNLGVPGVTKAQCSACFINSVDDSMESILELAKTEGLIFKEGSGSGVNFSKLRGSTEHIKGGGRASGPVSFMQGYDAFAGVILSGGRTRRAARMCILDVDHPDIYKFVKCKAEQEKVVKLLAEGGMSTEFEEAENAYNVVRHQSGNNSVRVTDEFMQLVQDIVHGYEKDGEWELKPRAIRRPEDAVEMTSAKELFFQIANAAHICGDPGMQFHDTINQYNTCANDGTIVSANPCSEFMWLNDSACNLASINLDKFTTATVTFDTKSFQHVIDCMITAQDILVDASSYPTKKIKENSNKYRPLGLGFANLGGLLMSWGVPYDSDKGRNLAASITSLMTGQAYRTSITLAETKGTFDRYEDNQEPMEHVLDKHYTSTKNLNPDIAGISSKALTVWKDVMNVGFGRHKRSTKDAKGFRNSQVTLLAPTGTIAFMMDCATTGIEPDLALYKVKTMVGGGVMRYVNPNIHKALQQLDYSIDQIKILEQYVVDHGHLEGSLLRKEHLAVFDCSLKKKSQVRKISANGHIDMLAAVQPFLSGSISKTVNMDHEATVAQIERVFLRAWERKLKCITVYRDGSKLSEPMRIEELKEARNQRPVPIRTKLPDDVEGPRHRFTIGQHSGYLHIGFDPEDTEKKFPREVFVEMGQSGNTIGGLMAACSKLFSVALQYEIPMEALLKQLEGTKFPPAGFTKNPDVPSVGSPLDYLAKLLRHRYLNPTMKTGTTNELPGFEQDSSGDIEDLNEESCPKCGAILVRTGTCTICRNCAYSDGVCG